MTDVAATRSTEEIEDLKRQWRADPNWDIEDTEGFEAHREELIAFRSQCEAEWSRRNEERLDQKAKELGCAGNRDLAAYVLSLESRIKALETRLDTVEAR